MKKAKIIMPLLAIITFAVPSWVGGGYHCMDEYDFQESKHAVKLLPKKYK